MGTCEHVLTIRSLNPDVDGAVEPSKAKALTSLEVHYGRGRPRKTVTRTIEALRWGGIIRRTGRGAYDFIGPRCPDCERARIARLVARYEGLIAELERPVFWTLTIRIPLPR